MKESEKDPTPKQAASLGVGKLLAGESAGVIRSIITALEKPIWSNVETIVVTHVAENGDIITRTRTKGLTIPLGVPVLIVGSVVLWEVGKDIAAGLSSIPGAVATAASLLNPTTWAIAPLLNQQTDVRLIDFFSGGKFSQALAGQALSKDGAATLTYTRSPTAMASISNLVQNMIDPVATIVGQVGPVVAMGAIAQLFGGPSSTPAPAPAQVPTTWLESAPPPTIGDTPTHVTTTSYKGYTIYWAFENGHWVNVSPPIA